MELSRLIRVRFFHRVSIYSLETENGTLATEATGEIYDFPQKVIITQVRRVAFKQWNWPRTPGHYQLVTGLVKVYGLHFYHSL